MYSLFIFIRKIEFIIEILLGLRFIVSWLMPYNHNIFTDTIYSLTEPLLRPFRSIITFGNLGIDLAPIILIFILRLIFSILYKFLFLFIF